MKRSKKVVTKHHHIKVEIIDNYRAKTLDNIFVSVYGYVIRVSEGFITDGASVPMLFWSIGYTPFCLDTLRGAIVHDYIYRERKDITRFWCDMIFLFLMKESGASFIKRWSYFIMVRLFGWISRR